MNKTALITGLLILTVTAAAQPRYDLLLKGGHVIDPRNGINRLQDVAVADGKIALLADSIHPSEAAKTVDVSGLYVTPGLIDIHVHVYAGTGMRGAYSGDNSVYPGRLHIPQRRHDRGRRRQLRLAQLRRFQRPCHRPIEDPRAGDAQYRRAWHGRRRD